MSYVRIIDFSPFPDPQSSPKAKRGPAVGIDKACREIGFFYLSNLGIDQELRSAMLSRAKTLSVEATENEKRSISIKPDGAGGGDHAYGFQRVDGGGKEAHEAVDIFRPVETTGPPYELGLGENISPATPGDFRAVAEKYTEDLVFLATEVVRALALALGVDEKIFISRIKEPFWNPRVLGYPLHPEGDIADFGILTFLLTDAQKDSLQVLSKDEEWTSANPISGYFLVNIGDMLSKWTDGIYKLTRHRVLHNSDKMRISVPFFFDPDWDAIMSPVLLLDVEHLEDDGVLYREKFAKAIMYSVVT